MSSPEIVFTKPARCRDCYACLRACSVKAIRLRDGQAEVVPERCISCGTCVLTCPQQAKDYRRDRGQVAALLASGRPVNISLAPSFAAIFPPSSCDGCPRRSDSSAFNTSSKRR